MQLRLDPSNLDATQSLGEEERARSDLYAVLARLLGQAPAAADLVLLGQVRGEAGVLGEAIDAVAAAALRTTSDAVSVEYHNLFIGLGRGELLPYGSYYLTGFLQEKPLAKLRRDLAALGIVASGKSSDPEDHAASILEVMAGLVRGDFGIEHSLDAELQFFTDHIEPWMPVFFRDLEKAKSADFYAAVGRVGLTFIDVECQAFAMRA